MNFLPTTRQELEDLQWSQLDIILVSGDTYIDSPFIGIAVIGRILTYAGYRVGIIAQPDTQSDTDICRLGEPRLFWGVTGGSVDSMVANYTASKKKRKRDDFTPGGDNNRRPDKALISYSNLIKRFFKSSKPIVLGGIEASLRRIAHYDFWSNRIRKSVLFDSKADILVYGMAEKTILALARHLDRKTCYKSVPGICFPDTAPPSDYIELPSFFDVSGSHESFIKMFNIFYQNNEPKTAQGLAQKHDNRYLIQNPPSAYPTKEELDQIHELPYCRSVHPYYLKQGKVKAQETIQFSITTHRGCYGECNFCAIAVHQGRTVCSRSSRSIIKEAQALTSHPDFKKIIPDLGGPTANMFGFECQIKLTKGPCRNKRCLTPSVCKHLEVDHSAQISLLNKLSRLPGIKHIFVSSGLRYDMVLADPKGHQYLKLIVKSHTSGQMKIAPEHSVKKVLDTMGKPGIDHLTAFKKSFDKLSEQCGKKQFLTYYMIAAHPGCNEQDMISLKKFCTQELRTTPEQAQIFTPTPSTYSTLMYYTEVNPVDGKKIFVEKNLQRKEKQKRILTKRFTKK